MTDVRDPQLHTLECFTTLSALRPAWPGALVLNVTLDAAGAALARAAHVAGACCLTIEPDAVQARAALRSGACDFVVNTLDEALRALKNEIRRQRPLSVGLHGEPAAVLDEALSRGVAPALFAAPDAFPREAAGLAAFGAALVPFRSGRGSPESAAVLDAFLRSRSWQAYTVTSANREAMNAFDSRALALLGADPLRSRWLTLAPRLFPRDLHRTLWLTAAEAAQLGVRASSLQM